MEVRRCVRQSRAAAEAIRESPARARREPLVVSTAVAGPGSAPGPALLPRYLLLIVVLNDAVLLLRSGSGVLALAA